MKNYGNYWLVLTGRPGQEQRIKFKVHGEEAEKVSLEQLDYVLSQIKSLDDFYGYIKRQGINFDFAPKSVSIVYRHNKEDIHIDPIFNNPLITKTAGEVMEKKKAKRKAKEAKQDYKNIDTSINYESKEIEQVVKILKNMVLNQETRKATLAALPYYFKKELKDYIDSFDKITDTRNYEINSITKELTGALTNYRTFRDIQIVLNTIDKKLNKPVTKKVTEVEGQMTLAEYMETHVETKEEEKLDEELESALNEYSEELNDVYKMKEDIAENEDHEYQYIIDPIALEAYDACGNDPEGILEYLGYDKAISLSDNDKWVLGLTDDMFSRGRR